MKHLDLFSGIGGFALAARRVGWQTVGFCEIDPYCQRVLAKHWPSVPIHTDVRELTGDAVGLVDIITGGFPCQPYSLAGKRGGAGDDRDLWPEMRRVIREVGPDLVVGENTYGIVGLALDDVLSDLEVLGYTAEAIVIPACAVNAPHRRDRVWIIAHARSIGPQEREHVAGASNEAASRKRERCPLNGIPAPEDAAHTERRQRSLGRTAGRAGRVWECFPGDGDWQGEDQPTLDGEDDGIPARLDRLRALGNAIVPQVAEMIFRSLPHRDGGRNG